MTSSRKHTFDSIAFKRKVQGEIYEELKDLSPEEEIAYFRRAAETGSLADWWKAVRSVAAERVGRGT